MLVTMVAFLAGTVSVLTPCVLPLLPAILAVSADGGRRRVAGLIIGLVGAFSLGLVAISLAVGLVGLPPDVIRWAAVALIAVMGLLFLLPGALDRLEAAISRATSRFRPGPATGFGSGLVTGAGLGIVWTPCAGPILAAASAAVATQRLGPATIVHVLAFALGMAVPLSAIALGGQRLGGWLRTRIAPGQLTAATGVILLVTAAILASGLDTKVNRWVAENTTLSSTVTADLEWQALGGSENTVPAEKGPPPPTAAQLAVSGYPERGQVSDLGPAPALVGLGPWLNTPGGRGLSADDLADKVVLIDFWTYSCINCLRTLPYLRSWHETYADDGLVILGVHAPEFEFETVPENVARAVSDLDVRWPVAQDNDFRTWQAFHNQYWPAKYLIDRTGQVRYAHYGEGAYEDTERAIQDLLGQSSTPLAIADEAPDRNPRTPETYLGYRRMASFAGDVEPDRPKDYGPPPPGGFTSLPPDAWTLSGTWTVEPSRAVAGTDARLALHYRGEDVFLVLGPADPGAPAPPGGAGVVRVSDSARPGRVREIDVDSHRLYPLRQSDRPTDGVMTVAAPPGIAVYAFTFG